MTRDREGATAPAEASAVRVRAASATDAGLVRPQNEDFVAIGDLDRGVLAQAGESARADSPRRGLLFIVCDGMGGVAGGEIASDLAGRALWAAMRDAAATREVSIFARHLRRGARVANQLVLREGRERGLRGMGTTLSAAGLAGSTLVIAHIGDSRVYVERGGALSQVTRDQSVVSALWSAGRITEGEAARSPNRGTILQALGIGEDVDVSLSVAELCRGDRVLVVSDGVHGVLSDAEIAEALGSADDRADVEGALEALLSRVRSAGAPDNASAIAAHITGGGLEPPGPDIELPFAELDPAAEGEAALSGTSRVARRLAARAGLRENEPDEADIAATRQRLFVDPPLGPAAPAAQASPPPGPATEALAARSRLGVGTYLAAVLAAAAVALLLWRFAL